MCELFNLHIIKKICEIQRFHSPKLCEKLTFPLSHAETVCKGFFTRLLYVAALTANATTIMAVHAP
jgi:hypothetical protein